VRVVREVDGGIVQRVVLLDDADGEVEPVSRFLSHLNDSNYSPNTVCAYGYDLRHLAVFLDERSLMWNDFVPPTALEFLGYLRRVPSRRPAQRLGLTVATEQGRLLSPATVQRSYPAAFNLSDVFVRMSGVGLATLLLRHGSGTARGGEWPKAACRASAPLGRRPQWLLPLRRRRASTGAG